MILALQPVATPLELEVKIWLDLLVTFQCVKVVTVLLMKFLFFAHRL